MISRKINTKKLLITFFIAAAMMVISAFLVSPLIVKAQAIDNFYWLVRGSAFTPNTIFQIDKSTNTVISTAGAGGRSFSAMVDNESLWMSDFDSGTVLRFRKSANIGSDPGRLVASIPVGSQPSGIAVDNDSVWVAVATFPTTIKRISKATNSVVATITAPGVNSFKALAVDSESVWLSDFHSGGIGFISKIRKSDNTILSTTNVGVRPLDIIADTDSVWFISNSNDGGSIDPRVTRLDKATNSIVASIPLFNFGHYVGSIAFDDEGFIWVGLGTPFACPCVGSTVLKIDKRTNAIVAVINIPSEGSAIVSIDNESVWTTGTAAFTSPLAIVTTRINRSTNQIAATLTMPVSHGGFQMVTHGDVTGLQYDFYFSPDADQDGIPRETDNCPLVANPDQLDTDGDGRGNVCDSDDDNDGLKDFEEIPIGTNQLVVDTNNNGTPDGAEDFDSDGITNIIDRNKTTFAFLGNVFSNDFDDRPVIGTTFGTIITRGGWNVSVVDVLAPTGVNASISGVGSIARLVVCDPEVEVQLNFDGESVEITCGSTKVRAVSALPTIELRNPKTGTAGKAVRVKLTTGQTVTLGSPITASAANTAPIVVEVLDETETVIGSGSLDPGQTIDIEPNGSGGSVVISNPGTSTVTFTMDGTTLTLAPGQSSTDQCPGVSGNIQNTGCPVADLTTVTLHIVDQYGYGICPDGKTSCQRPSAFIPVRVYDRNDSNFQSQWGSKNPDGSLYPQIWSSSIGRIGQCNTNASGSCVAGETTVGDYLVIALVDCQEFVCGFAGLPKSPQDFKDTNGDHVGDLATKDLSAMLIFDQNGQIKFVPASKKTIFGSMLEIVHPESMNWITTNASYPFMFTSDSDWTTDVCLTVPTGYQITGDSCQQTFVSGETKTVLFQVVETGSPKPDVKVKLKASRNGKTQSLDFTIPGDHNGPAKANPEVKKLLDELRKNQGGNSSQAIKSNNPEKSHSLSAGESLWSLVRSILGNLHNDYLKAAAKKLAEHNRINVPEWGVNNDTQDAKKLLVGSLIDLTPLAD
ncbi:MAG: hypothetical protein A3B16_02400 [Candidatus Zambryskibacteria bacterium RIFCSPLOWO2_01_FULL_45_43]|uniref:Uncharacterized protein n=1 Tax=Candidatus Zambryskibacteria bacterium RIFCSPLOWO2_01_FULL_45_43 TaxID=1802762 RepID=A0A1G2U7T2_9BACT|nr:MAG: hypothetical protein A3B16_02400 [Candidatus Zambryskibacteria bacterium RIFCSPLOWO2_01_FULL_45_43]